MELVNGFIALKVSPRNSRPSIEPIGKERFKLSKNRLELLTAGLRRSNSCNEAAFSGGIFRKLQVTPVSLGSVSDKTP